MYFAILKKVKPTVLTPTEENDLQLWMPVLLGLLAYIFVNVNYNIYYIDDAWVISNIWNTTKLGIAKDLVFIEPGDNGYVQYFGATYAFIMGNILNLLGWTKSNVFLVNSTFVWGTAIVWYHLVRQLPFSKNIANLTLAFLPIFPPFFFAAHCGRPEAFTTFIISLQLLLFIRKRYFLSAFLTGFAFEAHIMGAAGLFFLLAYSIYKKEDLLFNKQAFWKMFLHFTLGGMTAIGYYFAIHGSHFSLAELTMLITENRDMGTPLNNYILNYFMNYDWYSRIWEFALFLAGITIYFRKGIFKGNRFLTILVMVLLISTIITHRENKNYFVYIFPAFILLYFYTAEQLKMLKKFSLALTITMGLYYGLHFYFNSNYDFEKLVLDTKKELKDNTLPVVGVPDFWFAAMDKNFIPIHNRKELSLRSLDKFYLIQSDYLEWRCKEYDRTMSYYKKNYNATLVKELDTFKGEKIRIWQCKKPAQVLPKLAKQETLGWGISE
ncbi:MAG: hypothetical protein ACI8P3_001422 [Saprospiraceae bacterium]|jgi:hypothetical protein